MNVEINIDEKVFNAVAAQVMLTADTQKKEEAVSRAIERCKNETIQIDTALLEEDSLSVQMGLCMIGLAQVAEEEMKTIPMFPNQEN